LIPDLQSAVIALEVIMLQLLWTLWRAEDGQDLIEYTLLLVFVLIVTAGVMSIGGDSIKTIVSTSNSQIVAASQFAGS
jgi:Flp pilus assembly pilin Flp